MAEVKEPPSEKSTKELAGPVKELMSQLEKEINSRFEVRDTDLCEKLEKMVAKACGDYMAAVARENPTFSIPGVGENGQTFSIAKALCGIRFKDWREAGYERECFKAMNDRWGDAWRQKVTMSTDSGTASEGQFLVPEEHMNEYIRLFYADSVVVELGARLMPNMFGELTLPVYATGVSARWLSENTAITLDDPTVGEHTARPKQLVSGAKISNVLLQNSRPVAEGIIMEDMREQFRVALDTAALLGSGVDPEPFGVITSTQTPAPAAVSLVAAGWTFTKANNFITAVANKNALKGSLGWAMSPTQKEALHTMDDESTTNQLSRRVLTDGQLNFALGYPIRTTTILPNTGESIVFGDWSQIRIPMWRTLELRATDVGASTFLSNQTAWRGIMVTDLMFDHLDSFAIGTLA